ncbi:MAG TPA: gluconate 2-dehydrogenase subunit 3 family protein [Thermodesulfobacteriota bacterium]|nr:gluconate 2-dehydrogenase subunit 3 family protein [Thermodesulfobacteriota bacterium]
MKNSNPEQLTRRKFVKIGVLFPLLSVQIPNFFYFTSRNRKKKAPFTSQKLLKGKFEFFTPYQATVVDEITSLIIPTDEDPGAREAGVVFDLDRIVAGSDELKQLYTKGIEWLDYMAEKISDKESFLDLAHDEKIEILKIADTSRSSYIYKVYLFIRYWGSRTGRRFFYTIREQTFGVFYTSEVGWNVVEYQGPPQWSGYPDYYKCS